MEAKEPSTTSLLYTSSPLTGQLRHVAASISPFTHQSRRFSDSHAGI